MLQTIGEPKNIPVLFYDISKVDMGTAVKFQLGDINGVLDQLPNECPFCHYKTAPTLLGAYYTNGKSRVLFLCNFNECKEVFIAYYKFKGYMGGTSQNFSLEKIMVGNAITKKFNQPIIELSPSFINIYTQAFTAEQYQLDQVCGVGYRKALEFLIKDIAIKKHSDEEQKIKKMPLAQVIENYISDGKIKAVAKRAVWLGNDETHYERVWETKDLNDLKNLIDLTIHFIEAEYSYEELIKSMS